VRSDHFEDLGVRSSRRQFRDVSMPHVEDRSSLGETRQPPPYGEDVLIGEEAADLTQRSSSAPRPLRPGR